MSKKPPKKKLIGMTKDARAILIVWEPGVRSIAVETRDTDLLGGEQWLTAAEFWECGGALGEAEVFALLLHENS